MSNQIAQMQESAVETMKLMLNDLTLEQLSELQLSIAKRMSEMINTKTTSAKLDPTSQTHEQLVDEVVKIQEKTNPNRQPRKSPQEIEEQRQQYEAVTNGNASAKRTKSKKASQSTQPRQTTKTTKPQATEAASPLSENVHPQAMSYAQLRSILSTSTKQSSEAKSIAQRVAKARNAKSWATIGRDGFEELYKLLLDKRLIVEV